MFRFASAAAVVHASALPQDQWVDSLENDGISLLQIKKAAIVIGTQHKGPDCFQQGDGTSTNGETSIGHAADKQTCLDMVAAAKNDGRCPLASGATMPTAGVGTCYCENGWTGSNGSGAWITCGNLADEAAAEGDPHMTNAGGSHSDMCCEGEGKNRVCKPCGEVALLEDLGEDCFQQGDGTSTNGETMIGHAADKQTCLNMVAAAKNDGRCPLASGATMPTAGVGNCYCENGWTGSNGSGAWITCGNLADEAAAEGDPHMTNAGGGKFDLEDGRLNHRH